MVKHYPHIITWTTQGTPSTVDPETGFPVPGLPGSVLTAKSRYENFRGGSTKEWTNKANKTVLQRGTIYIKRGEPIPVKFDTVKVESPEFGTVYEGEILNVYPGQLNVTIAV